MARIKECVGEDVNKAKKQIVELKVETKKKEYENVVKKHEKLGSAIIFELFGKKD